MGEYIRLPNGEQLKLGTCGDWRYVRLAEAQGQLLDLTRKAARHTHDTALESALDSAWVLSWRFPWPHEDDATVDDMHQRNMFETGRFPLLIPIKIARKLEHDQIVSHVTRKGGGHGVNVWHPCPHSQDCTRRSRTTGVYVDVHCERVTEAGAPFTVFRCIYCEAQHTFTPRQITEILKANQPTPRDLDPRAVLVREILKRLKACTETGQNNRIVDIRPSDPARPRNGWQSIPK